MSSGCHVNGMKLGEGERICLLDTDSGGHFWFYCNGGSLQKSDEPCNANSAVQMTPSSTAAHADGYAVEEVQMTVKVAKKRGS